MSNEPNNGTGPDYHVPVMLTECLDALAIKTDGIYVDCTFGGGGHSRGILDRLGEKGKLFAFDQDEDAARNLPDDPRLVFVPQNFRHVQRFLRLHGVEGIDGLLADLGVSSHQFDEAARGFSIRFDAPLDMRMDRRQTKTAFNIVQEYSEPELHKLFERYGEVTNARTLAKTIVALRDKVSLSSIENFKNALRTVVKGNPNRYFAQVFQALRIEVNEELKALQELLQQIPGILNPGGRAAIITFHSLEDRLVKHFFRSGSFEEPDENPFINTERRNELKLVTKKSIAPGQDELKRNPRSRSARLRVAEKKQTSEP